MNLLVTGGAGFIGSHYARMALGRYPDSRVCVLDALTYAGNLDSLKDLWDNPRFRFYPGKIQDATVVEGIVKAEGITHILNFAAESHNDRSMLNPGSFIETNGYGVYVLLEATRKFKLQRMLHVSTDEVYGSVAEGEFTEESPFMPNTPYSASKAAGDLQCRAHRKAFGTPVVVTRGGNNYGPFQFPEKLIPFFTVRLIEGKKVPLYGDGSQVREWIHVLDHCEGIDLVLREGTDGEAYNIGDTNERVNRELVKVLLEETGRGQELVKNIPDPRRGAHDQRYSMSTRKVEALGWKPKRDFEQEVRATVRWYRENEWWWRPITAREDYISFVRAFYGSGLGEDL